MWAVLPEFQGIYSGLKKKPFVENILFSVCAVHMEKF